MAKNVVRALSLFMALAVLMSAVACKETEEAPSSEKPSSSQPSAAPDSGEVESMEEPEDIESGIVDIELPEEGDVAFYLPYSKYIAQSVLENDLGEDEPIDEGIGDINGEEGVTLENVENPIQMYGEPVKGANRVFNVETNNVVFADFVGHGSNVFPTQLMPETVERYPFVTDVTLEVERDRWMAIKGHMYRCWFQVDWITTTEEKNPQRKDYENNKDYQNYMNGIYDFDSERMKDVYPYFDVWKESGSELALNFGWKASSDIQRWFCFPGLPDPQASAPMDLDAFGRAAASTVKELHKRGYDNLTMLAFYNEPGGGYDFVTYANDYEYWAVMLKKANKWLKKLGVRDDVQIWSCGESALRAESYDFCDALKNLCVEEFDIYDGHYYFGRQEDMFENNYAYAYKFYAFLTQYFHEHAFYITENYCGAYGNGLDDHEEGETWNSIYHWWNDSTASFIVAGANTGIRALLNWGYTGGCLPEPQLFNPAGHAKACCWMNVDEQECLEAPVRNFFYETSLITNYIPAHSDTLQVDWTGDDIKGSAFKTPDGGYSVLIEANGSEKETEGTEWDYQTTKRNLTINLKGNTKKLKFYKYRFNNDDALATANAHATVYTHVEVIEATSKIVDEIDETHAMYIYTTLPPIKQIEINHKSGELNYWVDPGKSINLSATKLDCAANDEIVWSVSATSYKDGYHGTMTGYDGDMSNPNILGTGDSIVFTAPSKGEVEYGDQIAIRASLKSDPKVFDVVVIQITNN